MNIEERLRRQDDHLDIEELHRWLDAYYVAINCGRSSDQQISLGTPARKEAQPCASSPEYTEVQKHNRRMAEPVQP